MSVTTEGSAPTDEMPAGAMTDNGQPSAAAIEMPTGAMTGEATGDMAGAGSITERMGAAAEEMPIGSMLDAAAVTPGIAAGDMPAGDTGRAARCRARLPEPLQRHPRSSRSSCGSMAREDLAVVIALKTKNARKVASDG
jgi:hypothetical protein